jgi:hypothetical protein
LRIAVSVVESYLGKSKKTTIFLLQVNFLDYFQDLPISPVYCHFLPSPLIAAAHTLCAKTRRSGPVAIKSTRRRSV